VNCVWLDVQASQMLGINLGINLNGFAPAQGHPGPAIEFIGHRHDRGCHDHRRAQFDQQCRQTIRTRAPRARDFTNKRTCKGGQIDEIERARNRNKSKVRARVEHVLGVVKRLWGFGKVRYRGLVKNATRAFVALGLANIYLARGRLLG
jgi:hypothetical protein